MNDSDGPAAQFPNRQEAMRTIRALWGGWLIAPNPLDRDLLAYAIQEERMRIGHGPGPLWQAFTATLPGYREYEHRLAQAIYEGTPLGK